MSEQEIVNFLMSAGFTQADAVEYVRNQQGAANQVVITVPSTPPAAAGQSANPASNDTRQVTPVAAANTPAIGPAQPLNQQLLTDALKGISGPAEPVDSDLQKALNASMMDSNTANLNVSPEDVQLQKALEESRKASNFVDLTGDNPGGLTQDELQLQKVVEESLMNVGGDTTTLAAISNNPNFRKREFGNAVGLRNVGNTCYLNSLLQTYFHIPEMRRAILSFPQVPKEKEGPLTEFMKELQRLFAYLVMSKEKWVDPSPLLKKLLDKSGKPVNIGNQEDVSEFNELFLMRVGEGIDFISPVPLKSSSTSETIKRLFMGSTTEVMRYQEENGEYKETTQESVFANLILPVVENEPEQDLYSSLDRFMTDEVEYTTDSRFTTIAKKTLWLNRLPSILMLQQNRVKFDVKSRTYIKVTSPLSFEPQISMDRFFATHQKETTDVRKHVAIWREELSELEKQIKAITKFNGKDHGIPDALRSVIDYLNMKQTDLAAGQSPVIQEHVKLLEGYLTEEQQKLEELNKRYNEKKATINTAFDHFPNEHCYSLFAVWVHAGVPGSGHYWAYIRNFHRKIEKKGEKKEEEKKEEEKEEDKKKEEEGEGVGRGIREWGWKRFDDMRITDERNEVVMEQSRGGIGSSTAYFLIYLERELFDRLRSEVEQQTDETERSQGTEEKEEQVGEFEKHERTFLSDDGLRKEIEEANKKFWTQ